MQKTEKELTEILFHLCSLSAETEIIEFKKAENNLAIDEIGQYFSALSNEANLAGEPFAWLVFGVEDKTHEITGTHFKESLQALNKLKEDIARQTTNNSTFIDIHTLTPDGVRVLMFEIPAAPRGIPVGYKRAFYGRDGEAKVPLSLEKIERIRCQSVQKDWSAEIIPGASLEDLEPTAIQLARKLFCERNPDKAQDVETWSDTVFLNKAKLCIKGKVTRTALLLVGKEESEHLLSPADPKIRWILKDSKGMEKAHFIIGIPLLLAVDKIYAKIRNIRYRYINDQTTLFPEEVDQYDPFTIREALNNCIAHQDYTLAGRINVIEMEDAIIFSNKGCFIPGSVEQVVLDNAPESYYRNRFLVSAMTNLKMVETAGGGILRLFQIQRNKFFPLPDYELTLDMVKVTITGKILDVDFARMLARNNNLTLDEIIALDKVAKKRYLSPEEAKHLKTRKLIEGRKPNYFIAKPLAQRIGKKAEYSKNKAFEKQYYMEFLLTALEQHESLSRADIDELLWKKLPDWMTESQRKTKITNFLSELRTQGKIKNISNSKKLSLWSKVKNN